MEDDDDKVASAAADPVQPDPAQEPPEEQDEAAAPSEDADDAEDNDDGDEDGEDRPKRRSRSQRYRERIERLESDLAEERARSRAAAERPRTLEERLGAPPNPAEYGGQQTAAFIAAMAAYEADRRVVAREMDRERRETEALETERRERLARSYAEKHEAARAEMPDFDKVVKAARLEVNPDVALILMESDHTAKLEYHFAKNPRKLAEINNMSPMQAARAVGRLEAQLSPSGQKNPTQAPSPLKPIRGGAAGARKPLADLPMDEYAAARKAGRVA